ncbi:MAG: hypothetical protein PUF97_03410 [Bifidobacteriaceae bacterium]|nr:hypothetical protein [Bifidobacteriaceae bacterium]
MNLYEPSLAYGHLLVGQMLLAICCVFYLAWWCVTFMPGIDKKKWTVPRIVFIVLAALIGVAGLCLSYIAIIVVHEPTRVSNATVVAVAAIAFILLYFVTVCVFDRRFTCELFLIVGWGALEACAANVLNASAHLSDVWFGVMLGVVLVACAVSLVMYVLYYRLAPRKAFVSGMVPLITEGVATALLVLVCQ